MYDRAILLVREYLDEELPEQKSRCIDLDFEFRSYSRWAANELIDKFIREGSRLPPHIIGDIPKDPIDIVKEFIRDLEYYFDISDDTKTQELFYSAMITIKRIESIMIS